MSDFRDYSLDYSISAGVPLQIWLGELLQRSLDLCLDLRGHAFKGREGRERGRERNKGEGTQSGLGRVPLFFLVYLRPCAVPV